MKTLTVTATKKNSSEQFPIYRADVSYHNKNVNIDFLIILNVVKHTIGINSAFYKVYTPDGNSKILFTYQFTNLSEEDILQTFKRCITTYINEQIQSDKIQSKF